MINIIILILGVAILVFAVINYINSILGVIVNKEPMYPLIDVIVLSLGILMILYATGVFNNL